MKLYYSPGACSLSPHIVLQESGLPYEAIAAPTKTHQLADGTDYYTINALGYVPFLVLDDGRTLREGAVIVQYVADQVPDKKLAPPAGSFERYQLQEWLNFIGTCSPSPTGPSRSASTCRTWSIWWPAASASASARPWSPPCRPKNRRNRHAGTRARIGPAAAALRKAAGAMPAARPATAPRPKTPAHAPVRRGRRQSTPPPSGRRSARRQRRW